MGYKETFVLICTYIHVTVMLICGLYRYRAALQAKKDRTTKAAASFGPKVKNYANPKEVFLPLT